MEITVKTELCPSKRHVSSTLQSDSVTAPKVVKRRRRESKSESIVENNQNQVDQSLNTDNTSTSSTKASTVKRSSKFRGVSRHRWTGRYEAHLWDKGSWNPTQRKKGKQVYLGAYDEEESAARAYDLAALKYWGSSTFTNFPVSEYEHEIEIMKNLTKEEYLASLRRRSSGFSRGVSKYRGVARHHHNGRWEARIGRVFGNKYLYLGTYGTQEEAAHAYDIAAIEYRGINAVTNFDLSTYIRWLRPVSTPLIAQDLKLPIITDNTKTSNSFPIPSTEKPDTCSSVLNLSPFEAIDDLDNKKQRDIFQRPTTEFGPSASSYSSPTALGLLLKSSIFRDLVEKNVFAEKEEEESVSRSKDCHFGFISHENSCSFSGLESRDESAVDMAFCDGRGKNLWNFPLTSLDFY